MKHIYKQSGSIVINSLIVLLLVASFVYITGYKKEALFGTVYKSTGVNTSSYGAPQYGGISVSQAALDKQELTKFENSPITCAPPIGVFNSDVELARSIVPHMMDIQENTIGSCGIYSIYYSLKDKLGKTALKGGFRKDDIPLVNPDGSKNLGALEEIAKDTGRSIGGGSVTVKQMINSYKRNGASKCNAVLLTENDFVAQCSTVNALMSAGYDCNMYTYNKKTMLGHIATINTINSSKTSCSASVYDTTQQDPTKSAGKQNIDLTQGTKGDGLLGVNAPFGASMNLDSAGILCCK